MKNLMLLLLLMMVSLSFQNDHEFFNESIPKPFSKITTDKEAYEVNEPVVITISTSVGFSNDLEIYPKWQKKPKLVIFNRKTVMYKYDNPGVYMIRGLGHSVKVNGHVQSLYSEAVKIIIK